MAPSGFRRPVVLLLALEAVLFLVSLPGFGIETRSFAQYAAWAGPIFLTLTLVIFGSAIAGIVLAKRPPNWSRRMGILAAGAAVSVTLFDLSAVAGPPDPTGPLILSGVVIVVSAAILLAVGMEMRTPPTDSPSP
ncbi:MAG TPA: hypothetical protein VJS68_03975 [Thermoplasmata archaeon]|nr:hypothetical protein [Thermoplasmata archaeon]